MNDWKLLQDYAAHGSESAFRTLTERHLNLVYSAAMAGARRGQVCSGARPT